MAQTKPKQNKGAAEKKRPERRCVGCGGTFPKKELIRVVRIPEPKDGEPTPERRVFLDPTGKKSGRGAYLCINPACLAKARKTGRLHTALDAEISEEVYEALAAELAKCTPADDAETTDNPQ